MDDRQMIDAGTLHVGGVTWQVEFSTRIHSFTATAEGFSASNAKDWDTLADICKVKVSQSKTPVEVRFAYLKGSYAPVPGADTRKAGAYYSTYTVEEATATGIHSGNGKVLVRYDDGTRKQVESNYANTHFLPPGKGTGERLADIATQASMLQAERDRILEGLKFPEGSLKNQVHREVEEARKAAQA